MNWHRWLQWDRLVPGATILLTVVAQGLSLFGVIRLSLGENLIVLLLALLAVDALTERLTILEKIRNDIKNIDNRILLDRNELSPLPHRIAQCRTIHFVGMSLVSLAVQHYGDLAKKAQEGCEIRILVLNPNNDQLIKTTCSFVRSLTPDAHRQQILTSLDTLCSNLKKFKTVDIHITDYPISHNFFAVNAEKMDGEMWIEPYLSWGTPYERPCIHLQQSKDPTWFERFWIEYEEMWSHSKPYQCSSSTIQGQQSDIT
jgi:hypothetical protein